MNKDAIKGYWNELTGKLKQQWAKFTANDLVKMKGAYQELKGELQKKYEDKKEEAEKKLDDLKNKSEKDEKDKKD